MSKLPRKTYSETFKLEVLRDYYSSGLSMIATVKKWHLSSHSVLFRWIKCYPLNSNLLSLPAELLAELQMKNEPKSKEQLLEEEIFRLRKALELEKLRSHAFQRLIELTEQEEGISILKKDGAK
ncbi:transposase [Phocaeicola sp.]